MRLMLPAVEFEDVVGACTLKAKTLVVEAIDPSQEIRWPWCDIGFKSVLN